MQPTDYLYVYAAFSGESADRAEHKVRRADFVLWYAGVVFCMLFYNLHDTESSSAVIWFYREFHCGSHLS